MRRALTVGIAVALALMLTPGVDAYLKLGTRIGNRLVSLRWTDQPIRYFITNRDVPGVSAPQLQTAVAAALSQWTGLDTVSLSTQFVGFTLAEPFEEDDISVIGFRAMPDMDRTLGATTFSVDTVTGRILESDIFLNSTFEWSVAASGQAPRFDVQSIMTHEVGHLLGMGHSALGETELLETGRRRVLSKQAVMFPIAFPAGNVADRALKPDDRAGLTDIYGSTGTERSTGSIMGKVTLNGRGVFGAHVLAFSTSTGEMIATFALNDNGDFVIAGVPPGLYVLRAEPLDDADLDSFFDEDTMVDVNFRPAYASRLVAVPAGGSSGAVEIKVPAK